MQQILHIKFVFHGYRGSILPTKPQLPERPNGTDDRVPSRVRQNPIRPEEFEVRAPGGVEGPVGTEGFLWKHLRRDGRRFRHLRRCGTAGGNWVQSGRWFVARVLRWPGWHETHLSAQPAVPL